MKRYIESKDLPHYEIRFSTDTATPTNYSTITLDTQKLEVVDGKWISINRDPIFFAKTCKQTQSTPIEVNNSAIELSEMKEFEASSFVDKKGDEMLQELIIFPQLFRFSEEAFRYLTSKKQAIDIPPYRGVISPVFGAGIKIEKEDAEALFFKDAEKEWKKEENSNLSYRGNLKGDPPFFLEVEIPEIACLDKGQNICAILQINLKVPDLDSLNDEIKKFIENRDPLREDIRKLVEFQIIIGLKNPVSP
ncbi:hypothetical protein C4559_05160 [Candidatus Microgenomates bacterium]|nr:MAG: hypothetical protein C4559_05160 [Candidatus Microgenomates bacterium]